MLRKLSGILLTLIALTSVVRAEEPYPEGKFSGNARSYVMATQNRGSLKDWSAWAIGGQLSYHSPSFHGFGVGVTPYVSGTVFSNADQVDAATGRISRYEVGLLSKDDPSAREVAYLGQAYLDFTHGGQSFWLGRHLLKTPLFNPQDGRMIPTLAEGVWYSGRWGSGIGVQAGYLSHIAPRNSAGFVSVADSIGLYPVGRNLDGTPSQYAGNLRSKGLFIGSLSYQGEWLSLSSWDYLTENVFNAVYSDAYAKPVFWGLKWSFGAQHIFEHQLAEGGSSVADESYFQQERAQAFGGQIRAETAQHWKFSASYDHITSQGRLLFPREWGREALFVFQKRERSEGTGQLHAGLIEVEKTWEVAGDSKFTHKLGYGHYYHPDPAQPELNKYAVPSYYQVNLDTFYQFGGALDGLVAELLITYKGQLGQRTDNPNFLLNKVDMLHTNLIVNYSF